MAETIQRSFTGGELSPALYARADQTKYATGLKRCENFIVQRYGGVTNRPGLRFITEVKDSTKSVRLIEFIYSADQTYVIELGDQYIRFIKQGVQILSGGLPYEVATTYLEAELFDIQFVQSGNVVILVHPNHPPASLTRIADDNWSLANISFTPDISAPTIASVTPQGTPGSTTYTYVATAVKDETFDESLPSAEVATATGAAILNTTDFNRVTINAVAGATEYNVYRQRNGVFGFIGIVKSSGGSIVFDDIGYVPDESDSPPNERNPFNAVGDYPSTVTFFQQRLTFANTDNNPEKVWASRIGDPYNFTYSSPLQDDDSVTFSITGRQVNEVRHLVEIGRLVALTSGGEWTIDGDASGTLLPNAINVKQQGYAGSATLRPIIVNNNALYVQARGSIVRDLRYQFESDGYVGNDLTIFAAHLFDNYQVVDWAYQQIPNSNAWLVRDDGMMLGLTYVKEQSVWGWHKHATDGKFESITTVPEGSLDAVYCLVRRTINGATKRYIERFESRQFTDIGTDAFFVDSGLSYDGRNTNAALTMTLTTASDWKYETTKTLTASAGYFVAGDVGNHIELQLYDLDENIVDRLRCVITGYTSPTVVSVINERDVPADYQAVALNTWAKAVDEIAGLDHLDGKLLSVLADGNVLYGGEADGLAADVARYTVTAGSITLQYPYTIIHAGLPYTSTMETLDIDVFSGTETITEKKKLVGKVTLHFDETRGVKAGIDEDHLNEIKQKDADGDWREPIEPFTGKTEITLNSKYNNNGRTVVQQTLPLPATILAISPTFTLGR